MKPEASSEDLREILASLSEMREACCAAMRVIAEIDIAKRMGMEASTYEQRFVDESRLVGVKDGFGVRADKLLKRYGVAQSVTK